MVKKKTIYGKPTGMTIDSFLWVLSFDRNGEVYRMINEKHKALGCLLEALAGEKCFLEVKLEKKRDKVLRVYDCAEDMALGYPRWTVVSRINENNLIVFGDVTETGKPVLDVTAKDIFSLYKKWVEEGKPSKEYTKKIRSLLDPEEWKERSVGFDDYDFESLEDTDVDNDDSEKLSEEDLKAALEECTQDSEDADDYGIDIFL